MCPCQVPSHIKKGKQVKAEVKPKHVQVSFQDSDGRWNAVVDNELTWPVNKEESMWTLVPGEFVHVSTCMLVIFKVQKFLM